MSGWEIVTTPILILGPFILFLGFGFLMFCASFDDRPEGVAKGIRPYTLFLSDFFGSISWPALICRQLAARVPGSIYPAFATPTIVGFLLLAVIVGLVSACARLDERRAGPLTGIRPYTDFLISVIWAIAFCALMAVIVPGFNLSASTIGGGVASWTTRVIVWPFVLASWISGGSPPLVPLWFILSGLFWASIGKFFLDFLVHAGRKSAEA